MDNLPSSTPAQQQSAIFRSSATNERTFVQGLPKTEKDSLTLQSVPLSSPENKNRPSWFVIRVSLVAGLGGILFGYDLGVITAALPHLAEEFHLSNSQQGWANSILYVGGFIGAIFGGSLCDALGRKRSILISDVLFTLGACILFLAPSYVMVLNGRIVVGFAVALSGIADVSYLHEIAPTVWRGSIVSVNEACIALGFLLAFTVGSLLSNGNNAGDCAGSVGSAQDDENNNDGSENGSWRIMFGLSGVVSLIQFLGMLDMPESPRWLRGCGRHEESQAALDRINAGNEFYVTAAAESRRLSSPSLPPHHRRCPVTEGDDIVNGNDSNRIYHPRVHSMYDACPPPSPADDPGDSMNSTGYNLTPVHRQEHLSVPTHGGQLVGGAWRKQFFHYVRQVLFLGQQMGSFLTTTRDKYPRQGWIGAFLAIVQQLCGQTSVLSYAPQIFASVAGGGDNSASCYVRGWAPVSIGLVKFLITVLVIWKIEMLGRRPLLVAGMMGIAVGLFLLIAASGHVSFGRDGGTDDNDDAVTSSGFGMAFSGILLVVCGYSISFGPLTWLITSELFPTEIRGRALGISTVLNFGAAILVTSTFLSMKEVFGNTAVFAIYMLITVVGILFAVLGIPETKARSVAEIDTDLDGMLWWRRFGREQLRDGGSFGFSLHGTEGDEGDKTDHVLT